MTEIRPEIQRMIDQFVAQETERVKAQGRAQVEQSQRLVDRQMEEFERGVEWETTVEIPASELTTFFVTGVWQRIPDFARKEHTKKISEWVNRAESGDKIAQAVLLRARSILDEKRVATKGLPSFEWQEPGKTEK